MSPIHQSANGQEESPSIDKRAIQKMIEYIVSAGQKCPEKSKIVLASYGEDPDGETLRPKIKQYETMVESRILITQICKEIEVLSSDKNRNIYISLAAMRPDLPQGKKGSIRDIRYVLGFVADFDDNLAAQYLKRLPMLPDLVLETSAGRFQAFFLFKNPVTPEDATSVASLLKDHANCDHGTKDISHVWRIAGTLNWPNKKKVAEGRPRQPQLVKIAYLKGE
jgi:hypothetical protein